MSAIRLINSSTNEEITFNSNNDSIKMEVKVNLLREKDQYRYIGDFLYYFKNSDGGNELRIPSYQFKVIKGLL